MPQGPIYFKNVLGVTLEEIYNNIVVTFAFLQCSCMAVEDINLTFAKFAAQ